MTKKRNRSKRAEVKKLIKKNRILKKRIREYREAEDKIDEA